MIVNPLAVCVVRRFQYACHDVGFSDGTQFLFAGFPRRSDNLIVHNPESGPLCFDRRSVSRFLRGRI